MSAEREEEEGEWRGGSSGKKEEEEGRDQDGHRPTGHGFKSCLRPS